MFYHLLYPLSEYWSILNVFKYITFRSAYATVTSLLICFIFGNWVIGKLEALQIGETIDEPVDLLITTHEHHTRFYTSLLDTRDEEIIESVDVPVLVLSKELLT